MSKHKKRRRINIVVLADARFDSPGKCVKYCTYSLQTPITKILLPLSLFKKIVAKDQLHLNWRDCSNVYKIYQTLITDRIIATDRNRQIAKWIREEFPEVAHKFGPWHFVKNIKAKLRPLSQRKNCRIISDWIKAIGNHLIWCCSNCDCDAETLVQMWKSLLFLITNEHEFATHFPKYSKCNHKQYSKEQSLKKKWIDKKRVAYDCIEKIILDAKILKDMVHLVEPYHTGRLEVFDSLINVYATN